MLVVKKFTFNLFSENTYVVWDEESLEGIIIDPGCYDKNEEDKLAAYIKEFSIILKYLINTHCHIDHILGNKFVKDKFNPVFLIPEKDLPLIQRADTQGAAFGISIKEQPVSDGFISEENSITIGNSDISFLFTPGHTPGEFCVYFKKEEFCFTGDVLFQNSIGRTDLWNADYDTLINSINQKLLILPPETMIYPGHGDSSRIGIEKMQNPFL